MTDSSARPSRRPNRSGEHADRGNPANPTLDRTDSMWDAIPSVPDEIVDYLAIHAMRLRETTGDGRLTLVDAGELDVHLAASVEKNSGRLTHPAVAFAQRANRLLPEFTELSRDRIIQYLKLAKLARCGCYVLVMLAAVWWASRVIHSREIRLGGVLLCVLGWQCVVMVVSVCAMVAPQFLKPRLQEFAVFVRLGQAVFQSFVSWWNKRRERGDSHEPVERRAVLGQLQRFVRDQRPTFWVTQAAFHEAWFLGGMAAAFVMIFALTSEAFEFRHRSTIKVTAGVQRLVRVLGAPLGWLGIQTPDSGDVHYLLHGAIEPARLSTYIDQQNSKNSKSLKRSEAVSMADSRHRWAVFTLLLILTYWVLPRFVLARWSRLKMRRSLADLAPELRGGYFLAVRARLEFAVITGPPDVKPELEPVLPPASTLTKKTTPQPSVETPPTTAPQRPVSSTGPKQPPGSAMLVGSYKLAPPSEGWAFLLPDSGAKFDWGDGTASEDARQFENFLSENGPRISLAVVILDMDKVPTNGLKLFLDRLFSRLPVPCQRYAILSNGEKTRQRFHGDEDQVAGRIELWRKSLTQWGVPDEHVTEFDHIQATLESRRHVRQLLAGMTTTSGVRRAGKYNRAAELIERCILTAEPMTDEVQRQRLSDELIHQLRQLYAEELGTLARLAAAISVNDQQVATHVTKIQHRFADVAAELRKSLKGEVMKCVTWGKQIERYVRGLSGPWAAAGAALGLAVPFLTAAPAVAFLALGYTMVGGAIGGANVPYLWRRLFHRGGQDSFLDEAEDERSPQQERLRRGLTDIFRQAVLVSLILEMQGLPEAEIAGNLNRVLVEAGDACLIDAHDGAARLTRLTAALDRYLPLETVT